MHPVPVFHNIMCSPFTFYRCKCYRVWRRVEEECEAGVLVVSGMTLMIAGTCLSSVFIIIIPMFDPAIPFWKLVQGSIVSGYGGVMDGGTISGGVDGWGFGRGSMFFPFFNCSLLHDPS